MCAVDSKKIEEKKELKDKWNELKNQFKEEGKSILKDSKNTIKNIQMNKENPDLQSINQCLKEFIPVDM